MHKRQLLSLILVTAVVGPTGAADARSTVDPVDALRRAAASASVANVLSSSIGVPSVSLQSRSFDLALNGVLREALRADAVTKQAMPREAIQQLRSFLKTGDQPAAPAADINAMRRASVQLAAAVDTLLAAEPMPSAVPLASSEALLAGPSCDVQEVPQLLCVSGEGPNLYSSGSEHLVTIDLGGDDVYENATGTGACVDHENPTESYCVSVNLDLSGDDIYSPGSGLHACEVGGLGPLSPVCGQGTGLGGIGMLVDVSGNDLYRSVAKLRPDGCDGNFSVCGVLYGQGAGTFGVGALVDRGGDDVYRLEVPIENRQDRSVTVRGQGMGILGDGLLWDDAGNDDYLMTGPATGFADPNAGYTLFGYSSYSGQGLGSIGNGVLLDSAGDDKFRVDVRSSPGASSRTARGPLGEGLSATFDGQGMGIGAGGSEDHGYLLTGEGDTEYSIEIATRARASVRAQAWGPGGVIDDRGGADNYKVDVAGVTDLHKSCFTCPSVSQDIDDLGTFGVFAVSYVSAEAQGIQSGAIRDRGGSDNYTIESLSSIEITSEAGSGVARAINDGYGLAVSFGQGAGAGSLTDDGGNDSYAIGTRSENVSIALGNSQSVARAAGGSASTSGQGLGGTLRDSGGADSYSATAVSERESTPDSFPYEPDGYTEAVAQGLLRDSSFIVQEGSGRFSDRDEGEQDLFHVDSELSTTPCVGQFGASPGWTGGYRRTLSTEEVCIPAFSGAIVTSAEPAPSARVEDVEVIRGGGLVTLSARLLDAYGQPIKGAELHFSNEGKVGSPYYGIGPAHRWSQQSDRMAITDAEGFASTTIYESDCAANVCEAFRGSASFFGDEVNGPASAHS